ncbi:MAG: hypothetical protein NZ772_04305 [Cyanobacteria bacterium]|nr:hypothetical protein [Cyanobacteriota bacterium]MDW8201168.1 hypothetical protein [Cyanobacteriota bacterium SKYGB_h_bin112]
MVAGLPFVLLATIQSSLYQILITPHLYWSGARLAPMIALTNGYKIYQLVGQGPLLDTFYGPISYLVYLPATLTSSVTASIISL